MHLQVLMVYNPPISTWEFINQQAEKYSLQMAIDKTYWISLSQGVVHESRNKSYELYKPLNPEKDVSRIYGAYAYERCEEKSYEFPKVVGGFDKNGKDALRSAYPDLRKFY